VPFRTATEWLALLADAHRQGPLDEELRGVERYPLLVCGEVGYNAFDPQAANLLFMLVSRRSRGVCRAGRRRVRASP